MRNFRECIAKINSQDEYDEYANSGFYTIIREDTQRDTKAEVLQMLEKHFGLE